MKIFTIVCGLVCLVTAQDISPELDKPLHRQFDELQHGGKHSLGPRRLQDLAAGSKGAANAKTPSASNSTAQETKTIEVEFPTIPKSGKNSGLLLDNVLEDINQCAVEIIDKHDLKSEARYISGVLADENFIQIMEYGNYTEIRDAIVNASGKIIDRLGQDTEMILMTMPDPVVEWLRVTALLSKVDMNELNFVRNGTMKQRKQEALEKDACNAKAKSDAEAAKKEIENIKTAAEKKVKEAKDEVERLKAEKEAADKAVKEAKA